ncbi:MAG: redox-sensing transcriptional repressor Rex [Gemmatimonadota bacterium]
MNTRRISDSTVRRLSGYLRHLRFLAADGRPVVSSQELADETGTTAAQVRKDLSQFGSFGKRGRGYPVTDLRDALVSILGLRRHWRACVVGAGRLGSALLGYQDLSRRGFDIVVAFDSDAAKVGRTVRGVPVLPVADLEREIDTRGVEMAILAVPDAPARELASRLAATGVSGILNFTSTKIDPGPGVAVRAMDIGVELEGLSYTIVTGSVGGGSRP